MFRLQLSFKCENAKAYSMSIQNPDKNLTGEAVQNAFKEILAKGLLMNKDASKALNIGSAKLVKIEETQLV